MDLIYASHVFEYFDREKQMWFTKMENVLKPNGILRLAVPNFEIYAKLYYEGKITLDNCVGPLYGKWKMTETDIIYHKTTYDFRSLKQKLETLFEKSNCGIGKLSTVILMIIHNHIVHMNKESDN